MRALLVDSAGTLWVGTRAGGLSRHHPDRDRFETWRADSDDPRSLSSDDVTVLFEDSSGVLWVGTRGGGLNRFDRETQTFTAYRHDPDDPHSLSRDEVSALLEDGEGRFWVGTRGGGLDRWQPELGGFVRHPWDPDDEHSVRHGYVRSLLEDSSGRLWVGTGGGVSLWVPETDTFRPWRPSRDGPGRPFHDHVRGIVEDSDGRIWIASEEVGLYRVDPDDGAIHTFRNEPDDPNSLAAGATALLLDRTGILWIGTPEGVDRHDPRTERFRSVRRPESGPSELAVESVWALAGDGEGGFWVGDDHLGLRHVDLRRGRWRSWRQGEGGLRFDSVFALAREDDGGLWVDGRGGLAHLAAGDQRISHHDPTPAAPLADSIVFSLLVSSGGTLWVGTNGGLARRATGRTELEGVDFGLTTSDGRPRGPSVFSLAEDRDGTLWLGTFVDGLFHLDRQAGVLEHFTDVLPSRRINAVCVDSSGVVWAGSPLGLHRLNRPGGTFRTYRRAQGLPTDTVASIVEGPDGGLWLGTSNGLARLGPDRERIDVYTAADGLPSNELNQIAATRTASGVLAFGTKHGFVVFDPRTLEPAPALPAPVLTDVLVFNEPVPVAGAAADDHCATNRCGCVCARSTWAPWSTSC